MEFGAWESCTLNGMYAKHDCAIRSIDTIGEHRTKIVKGCIEDGKYAAKAERGGGGGSKTWDLYRG